MKNRHNAASSATAVTVLFGVGALGLILPPPRPVQAAAPAQQGPQGSQSSPAAAANAPTRPLGTVLAAMSRAMGPGVTLVADSTVNTLPVIPPTEPTTTANVEAQIAALVRAMPKGATWAKLYLPAPPPRRPYTGDAVADYAFAQARLFNGAGGTVAPGMVEILGQKMPAEQARPHVNGLNLQPVYILTNQNAHADNYGGASQWQGMTPEQRQEFVRAQSSQLLSQDPEARNAWMQQNFMIFSNMMRQLPPDQQQSLMQGVMGPNSKVVIRMSTNPADAPP